MASGTAVADATDPFDANSVSDLDCAVFCAWAKFDYLSNTCTMASVLIIGLLIWDTSSPS